jgi:deazaflavin-dependent oxidoreductase (nitroreductase family)
MPRNMVKHPTEVAATTHHPVQVARVPTVMAGAVGLALTGMGIGYVVTHRSEVLDRIRYVNKRFTNRITMACAGQERSPFAVIQHTGRNTGRNYTTPVLAEPTPGGFIIPLTYGQKTDWCRNVLHAGSATVRYRGQTYTVRQPEVVNFPVAAPSLAHAVQQIFHLVGIREFLRVQAEPLAEPGQHGTPKTTTPTATA